MQIAARTGAWSGGKSLPYDKEVEWIGTNSGAFIDTGVLLTADHTYDLSISFDSVPSEFVRCPIFGYWGTYNNDDQAAVAWLNNSKSLYAPWGRGIEWYNTIPIVADEIFRFVLGDALNVYLGEQLIRGNVRKGSLITSLYSALLFNYRNSNGSASYVSIGNTILRCHQLKVYKNGVPVIDFKPVSKGGIGYMFDGVSGQLFENVAGTGAFVIGPDKVSTEGGGVLNA